MTVHKIDLSFPTPPLTSNQRLHWSRRATLTRTIRHETGLRTAHLGPLTPPIRVGLHYRPRDRRRRDADNLVPTLKACCDGLVDARLVPDDTPDLMTKEMPTIHPPDGPAACWLVIESEEP